MIDPNPLREDEVETLIAALRPFAEAWKRNQPLDGGDVGLNSLSAGGLNEGHLEDAATAILRLDQVREGRGK